MTVAGVVLAAGAGRRFAASGGVGHKLLAEIGGVPLVTLVQRSVLEAGFDEVVLVQGSLELSGDLLDGITLLHNERWAEGIASSLQRALIHATAAGHGAVVVGLGDQPGVAPDAWRSVAGAPDEPPIAVAVHHGRRTNPVRLAAAVWSLLPARGDEGARAVMRSRPDLVQEVPVGGEAWDVDTLDDLERHR